MAEHSYNIEYRLEMDNGLVTSYTVEIDPDTMVSRLTTKEPLPEWTRLEHDKCNQCQYAGSEYCPIAARLVEPIKRFDGLLSHTQCTTTVITPERSYVRRGDVQDALRSLFGLIMATSGCPMMQPFKFMARYHLPFASLEETISRITSTYLMRQLITHLGAPKIDVDLKEIEALYNTMQSLNAGMAKRLKHTASGDGMLNAIVILGAYSSLIPIMIGNELKKLKALFE